MRVQVKDGPAQALRAMFAGIGQFLSITDKLRGKSASPEPPTAAAGTAASKTAAAEATAAETVAAEASRETVAETGVREGEAPEPAAAKTAVAEAAAPEAKPKTTAKPRAAAKPAAAAPDAEATPGGHVKLLPPDGAAEPEAAATAGSATAADLPLANYDDLSVASLRARLRNLSADQLGQLIEYEKSHAGRTDVITMFERRIAKLAEG